MVCEQEKKWNQASIADNELTETKECLPPQGLQLLRRGHYDGWRISDKPYPAASSMSLVSSPKVLAMGSWLW